MITGMFEQNSAAAHLANLAGYPYPYPYPYTYTYP